MVVAAAVAVAVVVLIVVVSAWSVRPIFFWEPTNCCEAWNDDDDDDDDDDDEEEDNYPRNMVCFGYIVVHTLHKGGGGGDKTSGSYLGHCMSESTSVKAQNV